jgi:hypothetical protein
MGRKARPVGPLRNAKIILLLVCFVGLESGGGVGGDEKDGRTRLNLVLASTRFSLSRCTIGANQKFIRAPVRFDFLANGRHNGG